jgi:hypothetical protein
MNFALKFKAGARTSRPHSMGRGYTFALRASADAHAVPPGKAKFD